MGKSLIDFKIVCTIGARGGSKGVKGKNTRDLLGKPLMAYTIDMAKESGLFDCIAVSSDSAEILEVAKKYGADFLIERPVEMATDSAAKIPAIQHCFLEAEKLSSTTFDIDVDLDVTSPLRTIEDIKGSIQLLIDRKAKNVITGTSSRRSPYFNMVEEVNGRVVLAKTQGENVFVARQQVPKTYDMNSSIYVWTREALLNCVRVVEDNTVLYEMSEESSIDIDSPLDWKIVELLMKEKLK